MKNTKTYIWSAVSAIIIILIVIGILSKVKPKDYDPQFPIEVENEKITIINDTTIEIKVNQKRQYSFIFYAGKTDTETYIDVATNKDYYTYILYPEDNMLPFLVGQNSQLNYVYFTIDKHDTKPMMFHLQAWK